MLKLIYTLFVGLLVVAFVGFGIDAFYEGPTRPEYPNKLERPYPLSEDDLSDEEKEELDMIQAEFDVERENFEDLEQTYNRNVSMIALSFAIVILVISLTLATKLDVISDGLILGGVFTLTYGIIRGFVAQDSMFRFIIVTIGLIVAFSLGYIRFLKGKELTQTDQ